MHEGLICMIAAFKEHCALTFWQGKLVVGPNGKKSAGTMGQFGRLTSIDDLPKKTLLLSYVKEAIRLNEDGVTVKRKRKPPTASEVRVPPDLKAALRRKSGAGKKFAAFTPSQRREYIQWLAEAKSKETRDRRLTTAVTWISQGKIRNWKYLKK